MDYIGVILNRDYVGNILGLYRDNGKMDTTF